MYFRLLFIDKKYFIAIHRFLFLIKIVAIHFSELEKKALFKLFINPYQKILLSVVPDEVNTQISI